MQMAVTRMAGTGISQLGTTVRAKSSRLDAVTLLTRLFHDEWRKWCSLIRSNDSGLSLPEDWDKVRDMIRGLGREDAESIIANMVRF